MATDPNNPGIAQTVQEVTERFQVLVREEIELAKTEVTEKVTKIVKGAVIGAIAGVFVLLGLIQLIHGFSWLAYYELPIGNNLTYFWGFFFVAVVLFLLGALAGLLAYRFFKRGSPPTPDLAIEEAQLIKETVQASEPTPPIAAEVTTHDA